MTCACMQQTSSYEIWLFGGSYDNGTLHGGLYSLDTLKYVWKSHGDAQDSGGPSARQGHAFAAYRGVLFCMGGKGTYV
jgi:hypothetical protein